MSKYNISMGNVNKCAIGPGAQVIAPAFYWLLKVDIDDALYPRIVAKCAKEGITVDELVDRLLRQYVAVGDGTPHDVDKVYPPGTLGYRPEYTFDEYVDYRSSTTIPIIAELDAFREFTKDRGALLMAEWGHVWNAFCDMQDAKDGAETQADALR